jgi:hypothetical protein
MKSGLMFLILGFGVGAGCATNKMFRHDIKSLLESKRNSFRQCYEVLRVAKPASQGRVVIDFEFNTKGKVTSSRIASNELPDPSFESCILGVVNSIVFPGESKPVTVRYPVVFEL